MTKIKKYVRKGWIVKKIVEHNIKIFSVNISKNN